MGHTTAVCTLEEPAEASVPAKSFSLPGPILICALLTIAAVLIHGYHPYSEDGAIYVPAVKQHLDHSLYPIRSEFFSFHYSTFPAVVAWSVKLTHIPLPYMLLVWHGVSIFLLLTAAWKICATCLRAEAGRILGPVVITAFLTVPVAGTAILLTDPYLTARSVSAPALLFAVAYFLERRHAISLLWLGVAFAMHPFMALYGAAFLPFLLLTRTRVRAWSSFLAIYPAIAIPAVWLQLGRWHASPDFVDATLTRSYFFLSEWKWYELAGLIAPMVLLAIAIRSRSWFTRVGKNCADAALLYSISFLLLGAAYVGTPNRTGVMMGRFQPMRSFHLVYELMFLQPVTAALAALIRRRPRLCGALVLAAAVAMWFSQMQAFPNESHVEWPWSKSANPWVQAFQWARVNTPKSAVFALPPDYMDNPLEDHVGFRAVAERSALADRGKDGGIPALFPSLADEWREDVRISSALLHAPSRSDVESLQRQQVKWVVIPARLRDSWLPCPYQNATAAVCQLPSENLARKSKK